VGVPVTILGAFYVVTGVMFSALALIEIDTTAGSVPLLWCIAGLLGLIGFWLWVFQPPQPSKRQLVIHAVLVALGVAAMAPLAVSDGSILAIAGMLAGAFVVAQSLLRDFNFEVQH
jgi:hypothetical protein